jgi:hypothetical protein
VHVDSFIRLGQNDCTQPCMRPQEPWCVDCSPAQPEPYTIGCPAHEPKLSELPAAAVLTAFPSTKAPQEQHQQQQQQHGALTEHPQLPVLRCRTTRHRAPGDAAGGSGTPLAGSRAERDGTCTPLFHQGGGGASPMHVDSCGMGAESDFTPRAGSEDRDMDGHGGHNTTLTGHKRGRGGRVSCSASSLRRDCCEALTLPHG